MTNMAIYSDLQSRTRSIAGYKAADRVSGDYGSSPPVTCTLEEIRNNRSVLFRARVRTRPGQGSHSISMKLAGLFCRHPIEDEVLSSVS